MEKRDRLKFPIIAWVVLSGAFFVFVACWEIISNVPMAVDL